LKYTAGLEKHGVIKDEPAIGAAIRKLISSWRLKPAMSRFTPALCHGDATTTNFIFPDQGQVVGIDWERLKVSDPATDIGRLLAEINHTLDQFGESRPQIAALEQLLLNEYADRAALAGDAEEFRQRALFHQASSTLRIARNGWISRMDRMALITRAMAMLSV
jgi:aminoglycoside phosphotransferase (APT) family kinase protein